ncbi:MAG: hypothetical protein LBV43_01870 [Prevotella sp.]|nr:hypothetical protein [Prevotella sp.]
MSDTKTYERNIYCLEGNWNKNPRSHQSIKPMLELLRTFKGVKYVYHKCDTKDEFYKRLQQFTKGTYKNYPILYFAFHGKPNRIEVENQYITLKDIATALEGKLANKIVHFGSCYTMRTSEKNIHNFITTTNCQFISGYRKFVDYIEACAFELLYFDLLQEFTSVGKLHRKLDSGDNNLNHKLKFKLCFPL